MSERPSVPIDKTTAMLIDLWVQGAQSEPPKDAGQHPSLRVHEEVGADWADWNRKQDSYRMLVAYRLADAALRAANAGYERES